MKCTEKPDGPLTPNSGGTGKLGFGPSSLNLAPSPSEGEGWGEVLLGLSIQSSREVEMSHRSHHRKLWLFSLLAVPVLLVALAALPHPAVTVGQTTMTWGVTWHWAFGSASYRPAVWEDEDEPLPSQAAQASANPCHFHQTRSVYIGPIYYTTDRRVPTRPGEVCN